MPTLHTTVNICWFCFFNFLLFCCQHHLQLLCAPMYIHTFSLCSVKGMYVFFMFSHTQLQHFPLTPLHTTFHTPPLTPFSYAVCARQSSRLCILLASFRLICFTLTLSYTYPMCCICVCLHAALSALCRTAQYSRTYLYC